MGKAVLKVCTLCDEVSNKRRKWCPKCGGELKSPTAEELKKIMAILKK
jgi:RNA polymerase subunit RPABC4/transcription elongation factor Spt4